jgi:predicted kinase
LSFLWKLCELKMRKKMPKLLMFVGPPASGKSTLSRAVMHQHFGEFQYVNQDSQGKGGHMIEFNAALEAGKSIIVDRMNFNKEQRNRYLVPAKAAGYETEIRVIHEPYKVCFQRALNRKDHETIKEEKDARSAIDFFFKTYERVEDGEANKVVRHWPTHHKPSAIICDLDGTLCNVEHRRHHVRKPDGEKKNWAAFNRELVNDTINVWCAEILSALGRTSLHLTVLCSGRSDNDRKPTMEWLDKHGVVYNDLLMRHRQDHRQDSIVKEIILDFEILTRYTPLFMIDDRKQVVDMWRKRGFICLQCDEGNF